MKTNKSVSGRKSGHILLIFSFFLLQIFFIQNSFAQEKKIKLSDKTDGTPISYAHYQYGSTTGITDDEGNLIIKVKDKQDLFFSHVLYGSITIESNQLNNIGSGETLKFEKSENALQPATVIALRTNKNEEQNLQVRYQDRLSHDAGSFLNQTPVIASIRKSGAYGFDPVFRGFKYEQVNLVIDGGQSAIAACPNRMDPPASQIALNMVDKVEILKGPYSLRYGNAFGGTLNFKTQNPVYSESLKPVGRVSGSYESNGGIYRTEAVAGARTKKSNINVYGAYSNGGDYADGEGIKTPSGFNRLSYGADIAYKLSYNQELSISMNNNLANDVDFPALQMDLRKDNTWLLNAKHIIKPAKGNLKTQKTMIYGTFVDHEMDNLSKQLDPRMVDAITLANTKVYGGKTESRINFGTAWMYAGIDIRIDEADGYRTRDFLMGPMAGNTVKDNVWQNSIINKTGVFSEYHFNVARTYFIASARIEYNKANARDVSDGFSQQYTNVSSSHINPGISFGMVHDFENNFNMGIWLGRVQRSGSLAERYINYLPIGLDPYEMLGNPQLKPEVNNQVDISFNWDSKSTNVELGLFTAYLQDYIFSIIRDELSPAMPTSPGVRQFSNLEKAMKIGAEFSWSQVLPANMNSNVAIAYLYAENLVTNNPLPEIPPLDLRITLAGKYFKQKLKPELLFRYVAEQTRVDEGFGETNTPSFYLFDFKASYSISKNYFLSAGVQNIFDKAYYEHLNRSVKGTNSRAIYAPGRSYYVSFSINFM